MADTGLRHELEIAFDPGPAFPSVSLLPRTMAWLDAERKAPRSFSLVQELALASLLIAVVVLLAIGIAQLRALTKPGPVRDHPSVSTVSCSVSPLRMVNATVGWQGDPDRTDWYGYPLRTTDGGFHWQRVAVPGLAGNVLKTGSTSCFLDSDHAWVTLQAEGGPLVVFRTADGGHTWQPGPPLAGGVKSLIARLDFIDDQRGWLLIDAQGTSGCAAEARTIYSTTDAGAHWLQILRGCSTDGSTMGNLAVGCPETGMTFVNTDTGWLVWDCGPQDAPVLSIPGQPYPSGLIVARTRDGGRSWQTVSLPGLASSAMRGCHPDAPVFTGMHGALPVRCPGTLQGGVFRTDDGGNTWTFLPLPAVSEGAVEYFVDADTGWAVSPAALGGPLPGNDLYRTTDGGRNWTLVKPVGLFESLPPIAALQFVNADLGFAYTKDKDGSVLLMKTTDGGETWMSIYAALGPS